MADTTPITAQRNAAANDPTVTPQTALDENLLFAQASNCISRCRAAMNRDSAADYEAAAGQLDTAADALRNLATIRRLGLFSLQSAQALGQNDGGQA